MFKYLIDYLFIDLFIDLFIILNMLFEFCCCIWLVVVFDHQLYLKYNMMW